MRTKRLFFPLFLAVAAFLAASCEDKLIPDAPVVIDEPNTPSEEAKDSIWIKNCPEGFLLGTETHIYASFNKEVPKDFRATLKSSDESILRVSPGASGWDFYVSASKLGTATLTLSFGDAEAVYSFSSYGKVIPTLSIDEDFMMLLTLVPSSSEKAYPVTGNLSLQMQGTASVICAYMDDKNHNNSHETLYDHQSVSLSFMCEDIPLGESIIVKDLSKLKEYLDNGIWSNSFEEDSRYQEGGFYYYYMDYYEPDRLSVGYDLRDDKGMPLTMEIDIASVKARGWSEEKVSIEAQ